MLYMFIYIYAGPILKIAPKYFFSEVFSKKIFQTKVIEGGHKRVLLIWF